MSCDLTNGRLLNACSLGRAGIRTLYFTKFNDFDALTGIVEADGEITSLGADPITIFQFDIGDNVGLFDEALTTAKDNGTSFVTQNVTLTLFQIKPDDLANLNNLKRGRWAIWALDFEGKIRLFGRLRGAIASGGSDVSGAAPGDKKGLDLVLTAVENQYAPFMEDYTTVPFDNFANVTVVTGDAFGPELHTDANAASDPNGNETNATTGWTNTGATFSSVGSPVNTGSYAFEIEANTTPTASARVSKVFTGLDTLGTYRLTFNARHVGSGGIWNLTENSGAGLNILDSLDNTETTYQPFSFAINIAAGTTITVDFREGNVSDDGGIYVDNLSLRKEL